MVVGHGAYEHGHGYTCVWRICMSMGKGIHACGGYAWALEAYGHGDMVAWVHGVGFIKSYARLQQATMTNLQAGGLQVD